MLEVESYPNKDICNQLPLPYRSTMYMLKSLILSHARYSYRIHKLSQNRKRM